MQFKIYLLLRAECLIQYAINSELYILWNIYTICIKATHSIHSFFFYTKLLAYAYR